MKTQWKKAWAAILVFVLLVTAIPATALAGEQERSFEDFFSEIAQIVTVENDGTYPFTVSEDGESIQSGNAGVDNTKSLLTLTAQASMRLSWSFRTSSEVRYDYLYVSVNDREEGKISGDKGSYSGEQTEYTTYTLELNKDDRVCIGYSKDSSTARGDDCVYLKDFQAQALYTVTFTGAPEGAQMTLTDSLGQEYELTGQTAAVPAGTYTCRVSAFGYAEYVQEVQVTDADQEVAVVMTPLAKKNVTFRVEGLEESVRPTIRIAHEGTPMEAEADGSYALVPAEYTWQVKAFGYRTARGSVTVADENQEIVVLMTPGMEWDGTVGDGFSGGDGTKEAPYQIASGEELAYLSAQVEAGKSYAGEYLVLQADLDMGGTEAFTPIGKNGQGFAGNFDGKGHRISGLYIEKSGHYAGLFGYVSANAVIRGVTVSGTIQTSGGYAGGIAGGAAQNVLVENCGSEVDITADGEYVGGIVGRFDAKSYARSTMLRCYHIGTVTNGTKRYCGGLAGYAGYVDVTECYHTGDVTGNNFVGGLVGQSNKTDLTRCYQAGAVVGGAGSGNVGSLVGYLNGTVLQCYHPAGTNPVGYGTQTGSTGVTKEELQSADTVASLGAFVEDSKQENQGYPILAWQDPEARLPVRFLVNYEDAVIEVKDSEGQVMEASEDGVYRLQAGTYTYTVSREECETVTGSFEINGAGKSIEATLAIRTYPLQTQILPADAALTLRDASGEEVAASEEGYVLPKGTYTYVISRYGYLPSEGRLEVTGEQDVLTAVLEEAPRYTVSVSVTDLETKETIPDASVQIYHAQEGQIQPEEDGTYRLPTETFSYLAAAEGYLSVKGNLQVAGEDAHLSVEMEKGSDVWSGEISEKSPAVAAMEGKYFYQITNAEELAWFADQVNHKGNTQINARLLMNLVLNSQEEPTAHTWPGIGSYSNKYTGTFDGNGKVISGYYSTGAGLITYMGEGGCVKNLTMEGTIRAVGGTVGGVVGQCYGEIAGCISRMEMTNRGSSEIVTGGIAGRVYNTGTILECSNEGSITTEQTSSYAANKTGGIVGDSYCDVVRCSNRGAVETNEKGTIYAAGIVGYTNGYASAEGIRILDCFNSGSVTVGAAANAPYAAGIAARHTQGQEPAVMNCYNTGKVTAGSGSVGAIAGDYAGPITNCYYLSGSAGQGVGVTKDAYVAETTEKTDAEMKDAAFVLALGNQVYGRAEGNYPIFLWQGGTRVANTAAANAVAEAKSALQIDASEQTEAGQIELPLHADGFEGTISWSSSHPEVIAEDGTVCLPESGVVYVTLTAEISWQGESDTKQFVIPVKSQAAQEEELLKSVKEWLEKGGTLTPDEREDSNLCEFVKKEICGHAEAKDAAKLEQLAVSVKHTGTRTYPANVDTDAQIGADGQITYLYLAPNEMQNAVRNAVISGVELTLQLGGQTADVTKNVVLGWDRQRLTPYLEGAFAKAAQAFEVYQKDEGAFVIPCTASGLKLPKVLPEYPYVRISWTTQSGLVSIDAEEPLEDMTNAALIVPAEDTQAVLVPEIKFLSGDDLSLVKEEGITLLLKSENMEDIAADMQKKLEDGYTADKLKDFVSREALDLQAVTGDIQLPTPRETGIADYDDYRFTASVTGDETAAVNGYRVALYRPMPDEDAKEVTLTVTMRHKRKDAQASKEFALRILPLTQEELTEAVSLMEEVKTAYWDGLNDGRNEDASHVTESLHPFQEAYRGADGSLVWAYTYKDKTGRGIVPGDQADFSQVGGQEEYNYFKSSDKTVISHESLALTQPQYHTAVTVESVLDHGIYGKYAKKTVSGKWYDTYFSKLYHVPVSAEMTVMGTDGENPDSEQPVKDVTVTVRLTGVNAVGAVDRQVTVKSDATVAQALEAGLGGGYELQVSEYGYISSLTGEEDFNQENQQVQFWGQYLCIDGVYDTVSPLTIPVADGAVYGIFANESTDNPDSYFGYKFNTWFHETSFTVEPEEIFTPQVYQVTDNGAVPAAGISVYCGGEEVGVTDASGKAALSFAEDGSYLLIVGDSNHTYSQCKVTVGDLQLAKDKEEAKKAQQLIAAIDEVSLESETAITEAREAYEALTDAQKALVGNLEVLVKAEAALAELKRGGEGENPPAPQPPQPQPTLRLHEKVTIQKNKYQVTQIGENPTVTWLGTKAKKAVVKIPAAVTVKGIRCKVTAVAARACVKNRKIKKVVIGKNVKTIGAGAWKGCSRLKTIVVGKNVTKIGKRAFAQIAKRPTVKLPKTWTKKKKNVFQKKLCRSGLARQAAVK